MAEEAQVSLDSIGNWQFGHFWSLLVTTELHFSARLNFDLVSTVAAAALDSRTTAAALDSAAATAAFVAAALDSKALVSSAAVAAAMCAGAGADNREEISSGACGCLLSHAGNGVLSMVVKGPPK